MNPRDIAGERKKKPQKKPNKQTNKQTNKKTPTTSTCLNDQNDQLLLWHLIVCSDAWFVDTSDTQVLGFFFFLGKGEKGGGGGGDNGKGEKAGCFWNNFQQQRGKTEVTGKTKQKQTKKQKQNNKAVKFVTDNLHLTRQLAYLKAIQYLKTDESIGWRQRPKGGFSKARRWLGPK